MSGIRLAKYLQDFVINSLLLVISLAIGLIAVELLMDYHVIVLEPLTPQGYVDVTELARRAAKDRGDPYDVRKVNRVIEAARAQNLRAFPAVSPAFFLSERGSSVEIHQEAVLPLGITANSENYYCNESGQYANFKTDKFGFRNVDQTWDGSVDIVAVGDSYTLGSCLNESQSIVGNLQQMGKKVLNLGMGGNGPLIELGSLVEYGVAAKPRAVIWFFFPNDFEDLERDNRNPILKKYMLAGFNQRLRERTAELNPMVDAVVEKYWGRVQDANIAQENVKPPTFFEFSNLKKTYLFLKSQYASATEADKGGPNIKLLVEVLKRASDESHRAGANFYFVYLPDCVDSSYGQNRWKDELLSSVKGLGVKVIDTEPATRDLAKSGHSAWFYCPGSHFNPAGAKVAAESVRRGLQDGSK